MDQIWSPWRMSYIRNHEHSQECVFCSALEVEDGPNNLVIARGRNTFVILNRYPYTSGHLMVVPNPHIALPEQMDTYTRSELMDMLILTEQVLQQEYRPEGFNIGANIGAAAGAGIAAHLHFHVVPRWAGDSNFMSTLANTRVLPEKLEDTFWRLKKAWPAKND